MNIFIQIRTSLYNARRLRRRNKKNYLFFGHPKINIYLISINMSINLRPYLFKTNKYFFVNVN